MGRLKKMGYLILVVAALLVLNSIFISDHLASVRTYNRDDNYVSDLCFDVTHSLSVLRSCARLYGETSDPVYRDRFEELQIHVTEQLAHIRSDDFDSKFKVNVPEDKLPLYSSILASLEELQAFVSVDLQEGAWHPVTTLDFIQSYLELSESTLELNHILSQNRSRIEATLFRNQRIMEFTLLCLILLLFFAANFTYRLITKEYRWHRYFHQLYSTVTGNVSVGLSIMDTDGHYEYMNDSYKAMLEIEGMDAKGLSVEEIFTEDISRQLTAWQTTDSTRTGGRLTLDFADGKKYVDYDRFVIVDENNQQKYVDFLQDNTQVEQMQTTLKQQLSDIEFYAKTKDAFLANMSHELRTPVNAILGITHLLSQTDLSKQQKSYIRKIESSSEMLKSLVSDVLDLSKIRAQALKLYPSEFRLYDVVEAVEDMFVTEIQEKGLTWKCDAAFPRDLCVRGDRTRILQILINLMSNAVKFTQKGSITLSAVLTEEDDASADLTFFVEDTGIGISKKDISTLFQEFHQLENHLTKQHKGTGLGLCISKNLAELMGGRMWVTSIQGAGSKFSFSLKLPKSDSKQVEAPPAFCGQVTFTPPEGPVLVVDDTEINREITVTLLESAGLACQTAADGQEAVDMCRSKPSGYYSLILMDIHMPRMNGFEAAKILKKELLIAAPVVALTATSADEQTELLHESTIDGFIMKPFKAQHLYETVSQYLDPKGEGVKSVSPWKAGGPSAPNPFCGKQRAIEGMGGLSSIYYKHVAKFKTNYADAADQIESLLNLEDPEASSPDEAKRLAHSIKGLAGTLGMDPLYEAASALDKSIAKNLIGQPVRSKSGKTKVREALSDFRTELNAAISSEV